MIILPELRDAIYDESLEYEDFELKSGIRIEMRDCAPLNLLITCRQLKDELEEQEFKKTAVQINDAENVMPSATDLNSQSAVSLPITGTRRLTLVLMLDDLDILDAHQR